MCGCKNYILHIYHSAFSLPPQFCCMTYFCLCYLVLSTSSLSITGILPFTIKMCIEDLHLEYKESDLNMHC